MIRDKFSAVWISHSSIGDYLKCPRAYFIRNVYRDPKTNHKVTLMQPPLALGQVVHDVIELISKLPTEERLKTPLTERFEAQWQKVTGKKGGFATPEEEAEYKQRGLDMIARLMRSPGPLTKPAIKIRQDLPYYWMTEENNIILCGKIDWLEYVPENDSVRIVDFKTGKWEEDSDSLQLPIYVLLAKQCQKRPVSGVSYWYLDKEDEPFEVDMPDEQKAFRELLDIGKRIELARKLERFVCKNSDGCFACRPLEKILDGSAELVGTSGYNQDVYVIS